MTLRSWHYWLAAAALAGVVFYLSSLPGSHLGPTWISRHDKLIHGAVYATLAALLALGARARGWPAWWGIALALGIAVGYGALDEYHQSFVPRRDASVGDLVADAVGALLGALLVYGRRRHGHPS